MTTLAETAPKFVAMAHQIVWCTTATVDASGGAPGGTALITFTGTQ